MAMRHCDDSVALGWTTNREQMHAIEREGKTDASSRNANCLAEREPEADIAGICDCACRLAGGK
jgi:hypothetical protein